MSDTSHHPVYPGHRLDHPSITARMVAEAQSHVVDEGRDFFVLRVATESEALEAAAELLRLGNDVSMHVLPGYSLWKLWGLGIELHWRRP